MIKQFLKIPQKNKKEMLKAKSKIKIQHAQNAKLFDLYNLND